MRCSQAMSSKLEVSAVSSVALRACKHACWARAAFKAASHQQRGCTDAMRLPCLSGQ